MEQALIGVIDVGAFDMMIESANYWIREHKDSATRPAKTGRDIAYKIEAMGRLAAAEDMLALYHEALDAVHLGMPIEDALAAIKDRTQRLYKAPPIDYLRARFLAMASAYKLESMPLEPSWRLGTTDPFDIFVVEYRNSPGVFLASSNAHDLAVYHQDVDAWEWDKKLSRMMNLDNRVAVANLTDAEVAAMLENINSLIVQRVHYGPRVERTNSVYVTKLAWNDAAFGGNPGWVVFQGFGTGTLPVRRRGEAVEYVLDANEVLAPYPEVFVRQVVSSLYPLPLHAYTMGGRAERRARGRIVRDNEIQRLLHGAALASMSRSWGVQIPPDDPLAADIAASLMDRLVGLKASEASVEDLRKVLDELGIELAAIRRTITDWFKQRGTS